MKGNATYGQALNRPTKKAAKKAKSVMNATTGRRGRLTGFETYESLKLNRTPVAAKARKIDKATGRKNNMMGKSPASYPAGTMKTTRRNAAKARKGM